MIATSHIEVAKRLLANVEAGTSDQSETGMKVPAASYRDPAQWAREMDRVFRRSPLVVGLSCDFREPGAFDALDDRRPADLRRAR